MKKVMQIALLLIMFFFTTVVLSGEIDEDPLKKLFAISGIDKQIAEIPGMIQMEIEGVTRQGSPIPDNGYEKLLGVIGSTFQVTEILSTISTEVKKNITEPAINKLLLWYESDSGRMLTQAEENAATPQGYQEMTDSAESLLADEKRVKFAKKLDNLIKATDMAMQIHENTTAAVFMAISTVLNPSQELNMKDFKAEMSAQAVQLRTDIEQITILSFVYSYKDIEMTILEKYYKFLEQPDTRKFNESVMNGIKTAFNQSIEKMVHSLVATFSKQEKKS
ncbi:MAG: hypothetical protein JXJ04_09590 [Spirochaetales bacterium]|nr:hypothetical protein [Spirochaetales bacterium]